MEGLEYWSDVKSISAAQYSTIPLLHYSIPKVTSWITRFGRNEE